MLFQIKYLLKRLLHKLQTQKKRDRNQYFLVCTLTVSLSLFLQDLDRW